MNENNQKISKQEADRIMNIPGNVRGAIILGNLEYAARKKGREIINKIEKRLEELGYSFNLKNIRLMEKYPEALSVIIILLIQELLDLSKEDIFEMGQAGLKLPYFVKMISKYFISAESALEQAPKYWEKYFDFGRVEISQYDKEKNYAIIRVIGYNFHPLICFYHRGYFTQAAKMATGKKEVESREIKCAHKGDSYHEYFLAWK